MPDVCLTELYDLPVIHSSFNCTIYDYNGQAAKVISQKNSSDPTLHKLFQEQAKVSLLKAYLFTALMISCYHERIRILEKSASKVSPAWE